MMPLHYVRSCRNFLVSALKCYMYLTCSDAVTFRYTLPTWPKGMDSSPTSASCVHRWRSAPLAEHSASRCHATPHEYTKAALHQMGIHSAGAGLIPQREKESATSWCNPHRASRGT